MKRLFAGFTRRWAWVFMVPLAMMAVAAIATSPKVPRNLADDEGATLSAALPAADSSPDPEGAARLFREAAARIASETDEDYDRAIDAELKPALARDPSNFRVRGLLASALLRRLESTPRDGATFRAIRSLVDDRPKGDSIPEELVVARVELLRLLLRHEEALALVSAAIASRPTAELHYQRGALHYAMNHFAQAVVDLSVANGMRANARYAHGSYLTLRALGKEEAELGAAVDRLGREFPRNAAAAVSRADWLRLHGRPAEALAALEAVPMFHGELKTAARRIAVHAMRDAGATEAALRAAELWDDEELRGLRYSLRAPGAPAFAKLLDSRGAAKPDAAKALLLEASELARQDPEPFAAAGDFFAGASENLEAADRYRHALQLARAPVRARYGLAEVALRTYELKEAVHTLAPLARDARAAWLRGRVEEKQRHTVAAGEERFLEALKLGAWFPGVFRSLGALESERNNEELAEFYFAVALRYAPEDPEAQLGLALARFRLDAPSRAVAFLEEKLVRHPHSAPVLTNLALVHLRAGNQLEGKNYLQRAVRADKRYATAFRLLGDLTREEGNRQTVYEAKRHSYRYALACYEMYSKLSPGDAEGYKGTADLYFDIRDLGQAAKNYHKVLELAPGYPDVRLRLAQISRNGGDGARAQVLLNEELSVNENSDAARVELGNIAMARKDFEDGAKQFRAAIVANQKNADAYFGLGVVHHLLGRYDEALRVFDLVTRLDPLKADVYWQQGLIYQKQRIPTKAAKAFKSYKAIVREPAALSKADEKLRELYGSEGWAFAEPQLPDSVLQARAPASVGPDEERGSLFELLHETMMSYQKKGETVLEGAGDRLPSGSRMALPFAEFELPLGWACRKEAPGWVCQNRDQARMRDAVVVAVAQPRKPGLDELLHYKVHLEKPRQFQSLSGESITSDPKFLRDRDVAGSIWVESLHLNSEVPDFYTRYFTTASAGLGVLVAFSVRKDKYDEYFDVGESFTRSLRAYPAIAAMDAPRRAYDGEELRNLRVSVGREFAELTPEEKKKVEEEYQQVVNSLARSDHAWAREHLNGVLSLVREYRDTAFYEKITDKKLAELAGEKLRRETEERQLLLRREVAALAEGLPALGERALRDPRARGELDALVQRIYALDPVNHTAGDWVERVKNAAAEEQRLAAAGHARKPASVKQKKKKKR